MDARWQYSQERYSNGTFLILLAGFNTWTLMGSECTTPTCMHSCNQLPPALQLCG